MTLLWLKHWLHGEVVGVVLFMRDHGLRKLIKMMFCVDRVPS